MLKKYFKFSFLIILFFHSPNSLKLNRPIETKQEPKREYDVQSTLASQPTVRLIPEQILQVFLEPESKQKFLLDLKSNDFFEIQVNQNGLDVVVTLNDGSGNPWLSSDLPIGGDGHEKILGLAPHSSTYQVTVQALNKTASGRIDINVLHLRPSTPTDIVLAQAFQMLNTALKKSDRHGLYEIQTAKEMFQANLSTYFAFYAQIELARKWQQLEKPFNALNEFEIASNMMPPESACHWGSFIFTQMAFIQNQIAQPNQTKDSFLRAIKTNELCNKIKNKAHTMVQLGQFHYSRREIVDALKQFKHALPLFHKVNAVTGTINAMEKMANCYSYMGQSEAARDILLQALTLSEEQANQPFKGRIFVQIGWTHFIEKNYELACDYYDKALDRFQKKGLISSQAFALDRKGTTLRAKGEYERALNAFTTARKIYADLNQYESVSIINSNISQTYAAFEDWEHTVEYGKKALQGYQKSHKLRLQPRILSVLAKAKKNQGNLLEAKTLFEQALTILEQLRSESRTRKQGQSFTATRHEYYQDYFEILGDLHRLHPNKDYDRLALQWAEKNKARSLRESNSYAVSGSQQPSNIEDIQNIAKNISDLEQARLQLEFSKVSSDDIELVKREIRQSLLEYDTKTSRKSKVLVSNSDIISNIDNFFIDDNMSILFFSFGKSRLFLWEINKDNFNFHILEHKFIIEQKLRRLFSLLATGWKRSNKLERTLLKNELSNLILGNVVNLEPKRKLIIIPDGILHYLPFSMLNKPGTTNRDTHPIPLIFEHEISYSPSLSFFMSDPQNGSQSKPAEPKIAIFADPVLEFKDARLGNPSTSASPIYPPRIPLTRSLESMNINQLSRLKYSSKEADLIQTLAKQETSIFAKGFAANKKAFFSKDLAEYSHLHIATHGLLHPNSHDLGGLVLSLYDPQGHPVDGFVRTFELYGKQWPSELVVLSACSTGVGHLLEGEGPVGLAQAFFEGGTSQVMVSLWNVPDQSTAVLMEKVYSNMFLKSMTPSKALQQAQIDMVKLTRWDDPYFWAGFVVTGKNKP